jgi:uncharacterized protein YndB with AHSA1/START domain
MWEYEHTAETTAPVERLWQSWVEMPAWPEWNAGIAAIEVDGPFAVGTGFVMTPPDGDPVGLRIIQIEDGRSFTDDFDAGDFVVRTTHRLEPRDGGTRVVYRTEITGPASNEVGPELGPAITADFPEVVAALISRAESAGGVSWH